MASVFSKKFYFNFDGVLLEVSRLVINKIMSDRFYDVTVLQAYVTIHVNLGVVCQLK
jgi:hypothetical protein